MEGYVFYQWNDKYFISEIKTITYYYKTNETIHQILTVSWIKFHSLKDDISFYREALCKLLSFTSS